MNFFSLFKKRKQDPQKLPPAAILRDVQEFVPEYYKDSKHFVDSKEFLNQNELQLALSSLIEMANESGHYFSEDFWLELNICADKMQLSQEAEYCRQQIVRNEEELRFKTPKGWTTIKADDNHFQHHIAEAAKESKAQSKEQGDDNVIRVTLEKLRIFEKYGGSAGNYERPSGKHLRILPYEEFTFIEQLVEDVKLVKRGLAAQSYEQHVNKQIEESCDSEATAEHLKTIVAKL